MKHQLYLSGSIGMKEQEPQTPEDEEDLKHSCLLLNCRFSGLAVHAVSLSPRMQQVLSAALEVRNRNVSRRYEERKQTEVLETFLTDH